MSKAKILHQAVIEGVRAVTDTLEMVNAITGEEASIKGAIKTDDENLSVDLVLKVSKSEHRIRHSGTGLLAGIAILNLLLEADKWARRTGAACMAPDDVTH